MTARPDQPAHSTHVDAARSLEARGCRAGYGPPAGHPRHRPRGPPGRGRRPARRQRRRQDDDAADPRRRAAAACAARCRSTAVATKAPLHKRARSGLTFVTEEKSVFMGLSTRDNLRVAGVELDDALALFPELERRLDVRGGLLSGGEQQMLTLARALAASRGCCSPTSCRWASLRWSSNACSRRCARRPTSTAPPCCSSSSTCARRCSTPTGPT